MFLVSWLYMHNFYHTLADILDSYIYNARGVELVFQRVPGVIKTNVGYIGGTINNPTYEQVCSGSTLHTEAVKVEFDKMAVSYDELLSVFWDVIDPTSRNKQGNDVGTQYRSGIYCQNQEQMSEALMSRTRQQRKYDVTIVTEIVIDSNFWIAEEYHQQYLSKGGQCSSKNCLIPIKCYG